MSFEEIIVAKPFLVNCVEDSISAFICLRNTLVPIKFDELFCSFYAAVFYRNKIHKLYTSTFGTTHNGIYDKQILQGCLGMK